MEVNHIYHIISNSFIEWVVKTQLGDDYGMLKIKANGGNSGVHECENSKRVWTEQIFGQRQ